MDTSPFTALSCRENHPIESRINGKTKTAEAMLKDLIARTEAVIRGEREDVI